jgi:hypothetical protein
MFIEKHHYKKTIMWLIILLLIFASIFLIAFIGLQKKQALFGLQGMSVEIENWFIMILCLGSILKIVYELYKIEKHKE